MEKSKGTTFLIFGLVFLFILLIVHTVAPATWKDTSSGMVYTTGISIWTTLLVTVGVLLLLRPFYLAVRERCPVWTSILSDPSRWIMIVAGFGLIGCNMIAVPYRSVATINKDGNVLQFEDLYWFGFKRLTGTYPLDKIVTVKYVLYRGDALEDPRFSNTTIFFAGGDIPSPISSETFARKLAEYTGCEYVEESYP